MSDHRPPKRKTATSTRKSNKSTNSLGTTTTTTSSDTTETAPTANSSHVRDDELTEDTIYDKSSASNDIETQQSRSATTTQFKSSLNEILKKPKKKSKKHGQLYSLVITVKDTTILKFNKRIHKPRVRICLYDLNTGKILTNKKTNATIPAESPDELGMFLTGPGQILNSNRFSFWWTGNNSVLTVDSEIDFFKITNFIIFFELIDNSNTEDWHRIAWSFLRFSEKHEITKLRNEIIILQLFKYQQKSLKSNTIFGEYSKRKRIKYSAMLNVQVDCRECNMDPNQLAKPSATSNNSILQQATLPPDDINLKQMLTKLQNRTFKIPTRNIYKKLTNGKGSSVSCFKDDSCWLAFTEILANFSIIVIFDFMVCCRKFELNGHESNIHSLEWMPGGLIGGDDGFGMILVSCSEDQTCIIWKILEHQYRILNVIYHPTFVYSAAILLDNFKELNGIATGCRDGILQIWSFDVQNNILNMQQELNDHKTFIISVQFNVRTQRLYSGDYSGIILEWKLDETSNWILRRKLTNNNKRKSLKQFRLCSLLNRIYSLTTNDLSIIELSSGQQIHLITDICFNERVTSFSISQSGNFLFLGYQKKILCWCTKSKKIINQIEFPGGSGGGNLNSIDFNSEHNILAVSMYSTSGTFGGGGLFLYGPDDYFTISNITTNFHESTQQQHHQNLIGISSSSNNLLNHVLIKLDDLFNINSESKLIEEPKRNPRISDKSEIENINEKTFSIEDSNRTFVVSGGDTFSIKKPTTNNQNTFTIDGNSSSNDTDISQSFTTQINKNTKIIKS